MDVGSKRMKMRGCTIGNMTITSINTYIQRQKQGLK